MLEWREAREPREARSPVARKSPPEHCVILETKDCKTFDMRSRAAIAILVLLISHIS